MPKFKDPKTGQIVNVNYFLVFLSSLLFGLFFFLYIGETQHALVMVGFAILITLVGIFVSPIAILYAYIFPLIYSFIAPKIVKDKWLNKGYIAIDDKLKQPDTLNKKEIQKKIQAEFYKPISEQEELEFWTTFLEYGLQGLLEKHRHLYRQMIDFSHKEPSISDSIPNDLKIEIKKQWEIEKRKDTTNNIMMVGLLVTIGLILLIIVY